MRVPTEAESSMSSFTLFDVLILVIVAVHLTLEFQVWGRRQIDVFEKYRKADTDPMKAAKWAYYCKALWLIALILLQYFGLGFRESLVYSFTLYAVLLQILLPFKIYNLLNLVFALGCLGFLLLKGSI